MSCSEIRHLSGRVQELGGEEAIYISKPEQPQSPSPEKGSVGKRWPVQDAKAAPQQCMESPDEHEHSYCQEEGTVRPVINVASSGFRV